MAPQTETKTGTGFKAGVKEYRLTYYTPDYQTVATDVLAAFRITPQPGVPAEEAGAAEAAKVAKPGLVNERANLTPLSFAHADHR